MAASQPEEQSLELVLVVVLVVGSCGQVANFSVQLSKKQFA